MTSSTSNKICLTKWGDLLNGGISIGLGLVITQPCTTWKTYSQSQSSFLNNRKIGIWIFKELYIGFGPNAVSGAIAESLAFTAYNIGKQHLQNSNNELSTQHNFWISGLAGLLGSPINTLLEQPMIRQQLYKGKFFFHVKEIYKANGIRNGTFKAFSVTSLRDANFNIGIFALNDFIRNYFKDYVKDPLTCEFSAAFLSGSIIGVLTNPLDKVKTLMHADLKNEYKTVSITATKIFQKEGLGGFFQGSLARLSTIGSLICATAMLKERVPLFFPNYFKILSD